MTVRVIVVHRVEEYNTWKKHFDAAADLRAAAGETDFEVLRSTGDTNLVVHSSTWSSDADARAFFESAKVARIRAEAGVEPPLFLYLDSVETGTLDAPPPQPSQTSSPRLKLVPMPQRVTRLPDLDIDLLTDTRMTADVDDMELYIDGSTGRILTDFDWSDESADVHHVNSISSHEQYTYLEAFTDAVADRDLRSHLREALDGRRPFRRFKDVLFQHRTKVGVLWSPFQETLGAIDTIEWLRHLEVITDDEAAWETAAREARRDELIEQITAATR
ncbi:UPF0158 family protein [Gordonia malaquae]|uniref:UPF0158 family protein n=1 Tax=Gordonia malaquae TaxID=410332 RepID=UPI0030C7900F